MQLKKITTLVLASMLVASPLFAHAKPTQTAKTHATKKITAAKPAKKSAVKTAVHATKKGRKVKAHASSYKGKAKAKTANETKKLYGVKGAKLQPTKVATKRYTYHEKGKVHATLGKETSRHYSGTGAASYYASKFNGRRTASGEVYNDKMFTAAHKTLAIGSYALVTNLRNGRQVIVRINDRGPFSKTRILDLSKAAAQELGMIARGVANVRVEALQVDRDGYISGKGTESLIRLAKREGLALKIRGEGKELAVKADESASTNTAVYRLKMVQIKTEKEARQFARAIKQKTDIVPNGKGYDLVVQLASEAESKQVKHQLSRLSHYQIFSYSQK